MNQEPSPEPTARVIAPLGNSASCDATDEPGGPLPYVLERWIEATDHLNLSGVARAAGALLLSAELDEDAHAQLVGADGAAVAPRRSDLLRVLSDEFGFQEATSGVAELEQRGVAAPLASYTGPWLSAELELERRVRAFCLGVAPPIAAAPEARHPIARVQLGIQALAARVAREPQRFAIVVRGRPGSGRDFALRCLLGALQAPSLRRSASELRQPADPLEPELSGSVPIWDARRSDPSPDDYDLARRWLSRSTTVAVAILDHHHDAPDVEDRVLLTLDVDPASAAERRAAWEEVLARTSTSPPVVRAAAAQLGQRSRAGVGLAFRAAQMIDRARDDAEALVADAEGQLATLVRPSTLKGIVVEHPAVSLERIIAPEHVVKALEQLVLLARLAGELETPGRSGVKALFSGPSGTGKTMAARAVASVLRRPLYRVDLAGVVSKWVGETEKNLRDALNAAETTGALLLFDEGDALFGKRGEVDRGSDRYANMEVSYLLQALEAYAGVAIVTTNVKNNVDKAFERRFDACIDLPPPAPPQRAAIWRQELGDAGRDLQDATLADIAKRAELSGGGIAAAARVARVLALHAGGERVSEFDVQRAVRAELLKSGSAVQAAGWLTGKS